MEQLLPAGIDLKQQREEDTPDPDCISPKCRLSIVAGVTLGGVKE